MSYLILLATTAALGGLLFGFDIAIITGAGPFLTQHFKLDDLSLGWAFSSLLFGCVLGSAAAGRLTDRYGRRNILLWVAGFFALTSAATGLAPNFTLFILARFTGGLAVGAASILSPMYVAEVSPPAIRGRMCTLYQLSIVTGILISYCINYALRDAGPANWRWMFLTGIIPSIVFFVLLLRAPETPRFLCIAGRNQEAFEILERIGGSETANIELAESKRACPAVRRGVGATCCGPVPAEPCGSASAWQSSCMFPESTPSLITRRPSSNLPVGQSIQHCFLHSSSA